MTTELKPCPVTWHMRTEEEIAASALPELPDGKIYGWMTKGGTIYAGEGYPVPVRRFALDNDSCVALMIATAIRSLSQPQEGSAGASVGPGYSAADDAEEYMTVTLSRDGTVTSHNSYDADFDEMVVATQTIITELQKRLDGRARCPYSHGAAFKTATPAPTSNKGLIGAWIPTS